MISLNRESAYQLISDNNKKVLYYYKLHFKENTKKHFILYSYSHLLHFHLRDQTAIFKT